MLRRRNSINADQYLLKEWTILAKSQYQEIQNQFKKTQQREGGISFYDLINILKGLGFNIDQKKKDQINTNLRRKQIKIIDINAVLNEAAAFKRQVSEFNNGVVQDKKQYLDAFVALGGSSDKTGFVKKVAVIDTVKKQFQLTFDIQSLIDGVPGDVLDFQSFCQIFQKDRQAGSGRLASVASKQSLKSLESEKSLVVNEKDFQKYIAQHENQFNFE